MERSFAEEPERASAQLKVIEEAWGDLAVSGLEARHVLELRDKPCRDAGRGQQHCSVAFLDDVMVDSSRLAGAQSLHAGQEAQDRRRIFTLELGRDQVFRQCARVDLWWAAALALYTGQRLGDVIGMLWSDIQSGLIGVTQNKTGKKLWIPMHAQLRVVLNDIPRRSVNILDQQPRRALDRRWLQELMGGGDEAGCDAAFARQQPGLSRFEEIGCRVLA